MPHGTVLIVEDDDSIRRLLMEYLEERMHLQIEGARDGVDALHQVSTRRFDVVILDLMMPYMSGVDFLSSLDALMSDPSVNKVMDEPPAVIVVTSMTPDDVSAAELQQRFPTFVHGVLRKPVDYSALLRRVESLLT
ncbi:MAG TPA: response regulator [Thermoanaerobaculia bacterium]|nr:response regulator [Thermoanaerobaculia bacterium]